MTDLRHQLGEARDQGSRPTCTSFAVTALHEASRCNDGRPEYSEEHLHFQAATAQGGGAITAISVNAADSTLSSDGQVPLSQWAYDGARTSYSQADPPASVVGTAAQAQALRQIRATFADIATAIEGESCVLLVIDVMSTFDQPDADGVVHAPKFGDKRRGLHAVVAVALAGEGGDARLLIRNSWDSDWCLNGHAYLSRDFVGAHVREAWVADLSARAAA